MVFLNHGSFGACPRPVFTAYQNWQKKLESQPVQYFDEDIYTYLKQARTDLGNFIGCDPDDVLFVRNPTTAINTIIHSLDIESGYEVLSTDHEYGSLIRAWKHFENEKGYNFIQQSIPLPVSSHASFVDDFWKGVTNRTKIIFMSQITSPTALIFPVAEICKRASSNGILTIIDGAHVPGHIPLNIREMNPDVYTGACHKWLSAPKGSTFLYIKKNLQERISPLVISWGEEVDPSPTSFIYENQYQGTSDPSAFLAVSDAIKFQQSNDWESVKKRCRELTRSTRHRIYEIVNTNPICPNSEEWLGQMASVEVPTVDSMDLKKELMSKYNIEIPIFIWKNKNFLRISINAYNDEKDTDKLLSALKGLMS